MTGLLRKKLIEVALPLDAVNVVETSIAHVTPCKAYTANL